jgi:hypothetical protein
MRDVGFCHLVMIAEGIALPSPPATASATHSDERMALWIAVDG